MKRINKIAICILLVTSACFTNNRASAQTLLDEVSMMVSIPEESGMNPESSVFITSKLKQICAQNGISNDLFSRFALSASMTTIDKNIVGGGQPTISQTIMLTLNILDNYDKKIFASTSFNIAGVGGNEIKAEINAIRRINNNPKLETFIKDGRKKIVDYYIAQTDQIIAQANNLVRTKQYEMALYLLSSIPTAVGAEKYEKVSNAGEKTFLLYVNFVGQQLLSKAKAAWGANQTGAAANIACAYIAEIYPEASSYNDGQVLYKQIYDKVKDDIAFDRKVYQDQIDLKKQTISAWRDIGVAYGSGQQPTTIREIFVR